ncbi:MAG: 30S ribosomal protein S3 [Gemmatimonadetes bacterium]|nr:30S ribosomal protein S3 [Gemmatimonadota bacterium]
MVRHIMNQYFRVVGGTPLHGTIRPAGNKNAALPMIAATLLADSPCDIVNVPRIADVDALWQLIGELGVSTEWTSDNTVRIDPTGIRPASLNAELAARIRASILLAGPLLARFGRVVLPPPGGDVIGRRRVDTHFLALETLGAEVTVGADYTLEAKQLIGANIFLDEPSVTATENALMAAVLAKGTSTLQNAASEPHVQDLARGLVSMGAEIEGIGSNTLTIHGKKSLRGSTLEVGPDHIEIGSFIGLAAVTGGDLLIRDAGLEHLRMTRLVFARLGIECREEGPHLRVPGDQQLVIQSDLDAGIPKIEIERTRDEVKVILFTARPGIIIGRKGQEVERLQDELQNRVGRRYNIKIEEISRPEIYAQLVAEDIAEQLSKRASFRRCMKRAMETTMEAGAKGIKVACAGRLMGAEMSRREWYRRSSSRLRTSCWSRRHRPRCRQPATPDSFVAPRR